MDRPGAVLFACTENALRSPMAEGIAKFLVGHGIFIDSVGVRKGELDPFAVAVMDEIGIDISGHRAKSFDDLTDELVARNAITAAAVQPVRQASVSTSLPSSQAS